MIKLAFVMFAILFFTAGADASENRTEVIIGGRAFSVVLADNNTAKAFSERMPIALDMSELNGNEKYHYLDKSLPSTPEKVGKIRAGDIMLYGDNCVVIFYKGFSTSYRYTRIGRIEGTSSLENAVGRGSVTVSFGRH